MFAVMQCSISTGVWHRSRLSDSSRETRYLSVWCEADGQREALRQTCGRGGGHSHSLHALPKTRTKRQLLNGIDGCQLAVGRNKLQNCLGKKKGGNLGSRPRTHKNNSSCGANAFQTACRAAPHLAKHGHGAVNELAEVIFEMAAGKQRLPDVNSARPRFVPCCA